MFEALRNKISKPAVEPNEGFEVVTEDTVGDLFSKFNSLFSEQKAYADEIPEDITELKKYITESEYLLIDGNMIAKEDIGTYIFINYGSLENYKKHLEQNGEEIVKIGDRDLIDLFKNDVEQARLESLKLQSPERNSSSDAPKNSQTAQEVKDSQSEISQVSPKSGSNSQTKTSPNSAQSQAASQSESTKPQSQASSSAQPKFTESKNATNPQSDNSNERPTSSNNLPLIFTLAGGIILSVMAFVALKKR
jgi:hypothetical protein